LPSNIKSDVKLLAQQKPTLFTECCYFTFQNEMISVLLPNNIKMEKNTKNKLIFDLSTAEQKLLLTQCLG